jgi:DNA helicase TIP49 (TBP-interacting protein)
MVFSKSFPKNKDKFPVWEEIKLSDEEEMKIEEKAKEENSKLIKECIEDAKKIMKEKNLKEYQSDLISIAKILFEKRASHSVYWKENKAKERFDEKFGSS